MWWLETLLPAQQVSREVVVCFQHESISMLPRQGLRPQEIPSEALLHPRDRVAIVVGVLGFRGCGRKGGAEQEEPESGEGRRGFVEAPSWHILSGYS